MNIQVKLTKKIDSIGHCEEENAEKEINIDYMENPMLGVLEKYYIKRNFYCDKCANNECEYYKKNGYCSVFKNASDVLEEKDGNFIKEI